MKLSVTLELSQSCEPSHPIRLVPRLGRIVKQSGPVAPTPQYKGPKPHKRYLLMALTMTDSQQVDVAISPVDKKGNPAPIDGVPEWSTDNTDVLALTPAPDGLSCVVAAVGPLGTGTVTMKADADTTTGTSFIMGTLAVTITGGTAVTVELKPGTPTEQP